MLDLDYYMEYNTKKETLGWLSSFSAAPVSWNNDASVQYMKKWRYLLFAH